MADTTRPTTGEWSPSAYFPIKCGDCGKLLGHLAERTRAAWAAQPLTGLDQTRSYAGVWAAIGVTSKCCRKHIMTFSARDELQMAYDDEDDAHQPPDFSFDEFIDIKSARRGHRDVATRYSTTTASYYNQ